MAMDTSWKQGSFIGCSLEVQEAFGFAAPTRTQVLGAVKVLASNLYGWMLWRLQVNSSRNTCVKDVDCCQ